MMIRRILFALVVGLFVLGSETVLTAQAQPDVEASVGGRIGPDNTPLDCDLPADLQVKNVGGSDGAGLCVFTSIMHSARFQNVELLYDFQSWMRDKPGGGWPDKVKDMIARLAKEKGVEPPDYVQVENNDLEILKLACRTGRMPGVTYSRSPTGRYGGQSISHMVSLVTATDKHFAVLDNNYIGTNAYEWMSPSEFLKTYSGGRSGWSVILLAPPPSMPPKN